MSNRYYVDAVSQLTNQGDVVKIDFVNLSQKGEQVVISNEIGIAMNVAGFVKFRDTINDLYNKMTINDQVKSQTTEFAKVSSNSKRKKKKN